MSSIRSATDQRPALQNFGLLIINADDWGRDRANTDRTLDCIRAGSVSSVSAMVFMEDSERSAAIAREQRIDAGIHLNFTTPFSRAGVPSRLAEHQQRIAHYLLRNRFSHVVFHPGLSQSFDYVVAYQFAEFVRLYEAEPRRIDGHHHMHLCANVVLGKLLPEGTIVRRNFSFMYGERGWTNRSYRKVVDRILARRHRMSDFFFSLTPLEPADRLNQILSAAANSTVELETHPVNEEEYRYLMKRKISPRWAHIRIATEFALPEKRERERQSTRDTRYLAEVQIPVVLKRPESSSATATLGKPHICVCICTYKRPRLLNRLLEGLKNQDTNGSFTYSLVVADNDAFGSAQPLVSAFITATTLPVKYLIEPQQNIALARNKAVENAEGDFVAFIDDDEFPTTTWLLTLFQTCNEYKVDGVLGPVKRHFDQKPPQWILKGNFFERATYPTGFVIDWRKGRTGNVLLRKAIFRLDEMAFRPEFRAGEDQDFFRRMIDKGHIFIWCNEAVAYEVVPPGRWKRRFMLRRALLRGAIEPKTPTFGLHDISKSLVAVLIYTMSLPVLLLLGHHRFMAVLVRLFDHLGKLLAWVGINPIKDPYVTG
jgi:glycosyltransferase involved in cell wall biosynthesis